MTDDTEYDRLSLIIITNWVLNLKLLLNNTEIASKQCKWFGQVPQSRIAMLALATCPAFLALLALIALKVLLNNTQKVKCCKELSLVLSVIFQGALVGHLNMVKIYLILKYTYYVLSTFSIILISLFNLLVNE